MTAAAPSGRPRILIVDDDPAVVELLVESLQPRYEVTGTVSARAALEQVATEEIDLLVSDVEMPEMRGVDLLAAVLERKPGQLVLLLTAFGTIELAVEAVRAGACDFVTKPFKLDVLVLAIERAMREKTMRREIVRLRRRLGEADEPGGLVARSAAMQKVLDVARRAARAKSTVLITGESGTGKGALARWIHERSPRRSGPLVQINCAALPGGLVEAELFGVKKGAFTDARESRDGLIVEAGAGTLFLDEIGEMPLEAQAKLLHVLESGCVRPIGGTTEIPVDARIIAATNRALEDAVKDGRFRRDLFFRLNVIRIDVPPLRERTDDIPELVSAFLARAGRGAEAPIGITDEALRALVRHDWPGNVRELANAVERAVALTDHDTVVLEDVAEITGARAARADPIADTLADAATRLLPLAEVERAYIRQVLDAAGGNVSRAARVLGIDRRTMYRKLD
ncbi:MAG: sigma-54 dependent transcriptional regulator [Deltaproteobacteria bacterium]|nr:sigma-54 dependent transcriptional regulator [Deltaproteobacteria bacterium]